MRLKNSAHWSARYAADAAMAIGTRIRAPIANPLPLIAKIEVMLMLELKCCVVMCL
jgi:hypothetical protein